MCTAGNHKQGRPPAPLAVSAAGCQSDFTKLRGLLCTSIFWPTACQDLQRLERVACPRIPDRTPVGVMWNFWHVGTSLVLDGAKHKVLRENEDQVGRAAGEDQGNGHGWKSGRAPMARRLPYGGIPYVASDVVLALPTDCIAQRFFLSYTGAPILLWLRVPNQSQTYIQALALQTARPSSRPPPPDRTWCSSCTAPRSPPCGAW